MKLFLASFLLVYWFGEVQLVRESPEPMFRVGGLLWMRFLAVFPPMFNICAWLIWGLYALANVIRYSYLPGKLEQMGERIDPRGTMERYQYSLYLSRRLNRLERAVNILVAAQAVSMSASLIAWLLVGLRF